MLVQPAEDFVVPLQAVGRLQHPVVLVGEEDQAALDPAPLQGGEGRQALRGRDAEVEVALDHQHRLPPVLHVVGRVELLIALRVLPRRAALLPLGAVEHAVMVDQALERAVPVTGNPVDHEAAVAGTQRTGLVTVEEGILRLGEGPALLQVFQRAVAPVLADGVGELLTVAGRAVEIDHHHRIARARIGLGVPAVGPAVAERALRPAVDQEGDRVFLALDIVGGLDDVAVDRLVVPAGEAELFGLAEGLGRQLRVHVRQATRHLTAAIGLEEQVAGRGQGVDRHDEARGRLLEGADVAFACQRRHHPVARVDGEQASLTDIARRRIEGVPVLRPLQRIGRTVPVGRDLARLAGGDVAQEDRIFVGLEARTGHGAVGQGLAVGREDRAGVPGRVGVGQIGQLAGRRDGDAVEVEVRAPGLAVPGLARREDQRLPVRGEGELALVAERLGRGVAVEAFRDPDRLAARLAVGADRLDEQVVLGVVVPRIPVTHEHAVIDLAGRLALGLGLAARDR
uniref:LigA n=1 Tax=Parastrongyloides trichosuri TaxID=131310 RepID=A0A0N4Z1H5_PARTI